MKPLSAGPGQSPSAQEHVMYDPLSRLAYTAHVLSCKEASNTAQHAHQQQPPVSPPPSSQQQQVKQDPQPYKYHTRGEPLVSEPERVDTIMADGDGADSDEEYGYGYGSGIPEEASTDVDAAAGSGGGADRRATVYGGVRRQASGGRAAPRLSQPPSTPTSVGCDGGVHSGRAREREPASGRRVRSPSVDGREGSYGGGGVVSGGGSKRSSGRRPVQFWGPFNDWWRTEFERSGKRPGGDLVSSWYWAHAASTWGKDAPSLEETRTHAKCLRSVGSIREYFRSYRARKKARTEEQPHPATSSPLAPATAAGFSPASMGAAGWPALSGFLPQLTQMNAFGSLSPLSMIGVPPPGSEMQQSGTPSATAADSMLGLGQHLDARGGAGGLDQGLASLAPNGSESSLMRTTPMAAARGAGVGTRGTAGGSSGLPSSPLLRGRPGDGGAPPGGGGASLLGALGPAAALGYHHYHHPHDVRMSVGGSDVPPALLASLATLAAGTTAAAAAVMGNGGNTPAAVPTVTTGGHRPLGRSPSNAGGAAGRSVGGWPPAVTTAGPGAVATATSSGANATSSHRAVGEDRKMASDGVTHAGSASAGNPAGSGTPAADMGTRLVVSVEHDAGEGKAVAVARGQPADGADRRQLQLSSDRDADAAFSFRIGSGSTYVSGSGGGSASEGGRSSSSTPPPPGFLALGMTAKIFRGASSSAQQQPNAVQLLSGMPYADGTAIVHVSPRSVQAQPRTSQHRHQQSQQLQQASRAAFSAKQNTGEPQIQQHQHQQDATQQTLQPQPRAASSQATPANHRVAENPATSAGAQKGTEPPHPTATSQVAHGSVGGGAVPPEPSLATCDSRRRLVGPVSSPFAMSASCLPMAGAPTYGQSAKGAGCAALGTEEGEEEGHSQKAGVSHGPDDHNARPAGPTLPQQHQHQQQTEAKPPAPTLPVARRGSQTNGPANHLSYNHQQPTSPYHHPQSPRALMAHQHARYQQQQQRLFHQQQMAQYHQDRTDHNPFPRVLQPQPPQQQPQQSGLGVGNHGSGLLSFKPISSESPRFPPGLLPAHECAAHPSPGSVPVPHGSDLNPSPPDLHPSDLMLQHLAGAAAATAGGNGGCAGGGATAAPATAPSLRALLARPDGELYGVLDELPREQVVVLLLRSVAMIRQKKVHEERLMDELAQVLEQQGNLQAQVHTQRMEMARMYRAYVALQDIRSSGGGGTCAGPAVRPLAGGGGGAGGGFTSTAVSPAPRKHHPALQQQSALTDQDAEPSHLTSHDQGPADGGMAGRGFPVADSAQGGPPGSGDAGGASVPPGMTVPLQEPPMPASSGPTGDPCGSVEEGGPGVWPPQRTSEVGGGPANGRSAFTPELPSPSAVGGGGLSCCHSAAPGGAECRMNASSAAGPVALSAAAAAAVGAAQSESVALGGTPKTARIADSEEAAMKCHPAGGSGGGCSDGTPGVGVGVGVAVCKAPAAVCSDGGSGTSSAF